eukprot:TRINITY_DN52021_c0_g1_i1.p1 TRINITY_DN52021_c0_g1~~TRINITY_DN52021_c0_g1_i1.p1  ORF type:complete len:450 (+),score=93.55 TRINITY_DN52021_c0_g1_i1:46-1395(+)
MVFREVSRLPVSFLKEADVHTKLNGLPAVIDLGKAAAEACLSLGPFSRQSCTPAELPRPLSSLSSQGPLLELREGVSVARSGGSFFAGNRQVGVVDWWNGAGNPLIFDTRRSSLLHQSLRGWTLGDEAAPQVLRYRWSRSPIVTLGRPQEGKSSAGLAFHQHERSWLLLASGCKRWYFYAGSNPPNTALQRFEEEEFRLRELVVTGTGAESCLLSHDQQPGECMLVPDGVWHCTYNLNYPIDSTKQELTFGLGGLGAIRSDAEAAAAEGDLKRLDELLPQISESERPCIAKVAAEQSQLEVLKWIASKPSLSKALLSADSDGSTALHWAAASGSSEVTSWLLTLPGATAEPRDLHGTTPAHWASRSGSPEVYKVLFKAGADLEAKDEYAACTPLHMLAAEGHRLAADWLLSEAKVNPGIRDKFGRLPEDWALLLGHSEIAARLQKQRSG